MVLWDNYSSRESSLYSLKKQKIPKSWIHTLLRSVGFHGSIGCVLWMMILIIMSYHVVYIDLLDCLVVDNGEVNCRFPSWLSSYHWHSLDGKMSAKMHHKNSTMHITGNSSGHYSGLSSSSSTNTGTFTGTGSTGNYIGGGGVGASSSLFTGGTRISCQNRKDISDRHVAIVAHHTEGW